jgi:iron complex transport system substrate-binding protein
MFGTRLIRLHGFFFRTVLSGLYCLGFLLSPFDPIAAHAEPFTVQDDLGRSLTFPQTPSRIVSLAPSVTEILFALGLEGRIVGVSANCDFPAGALEKPSVGYSMSPDLEKIVSLRPDLIILATGIFRPDLIPQLERLRLPVYVSAPNDIEAILRSIGQLGRMTGKFPEAEALNRDIRFRMDGILKRLVGRPIRPVLYVLWHDPLMTVGPGSFIYELIELAGGRNIHTRPGMPYTRFSMEEVVSKNPEVIIFPSDLGDAVTRTEMKLWKERWGMIQAVRSGNLYPLESDYLRRPGPRIVDGLELLARVIHPEVFHGEIRTADP